MELYVARHGQTDWNIKQILQGSSDIKLNSKGEEQSHKLKQELESIKFDLIICSPLTRAVQTAKIVENSRNITIKLEPSLIERNYGNLEGTSPKDIKKYWNYFENFKDNNVEPIQDFLNRIFKFMSKTIEDYKDKTVLLVTHCGVMIGIDCYINGFKENYDFFNYPFDNGTYQKYTI